MGFIGQSRDSILVCLKLHILPGCWLVFEFGLRVKIVGTDGITNPQAGAYVCNFVGSTAPAF